MVGTIQFDWHGVAMVATLADDFTWSLSPPDKLLEDEFNQIFAAEPDAGSPGLGQPGAVQLHGTAAALGGRATMAPKPADPPGTVF